MEEIKKLLINVNVSNSNEIFKKIASKLINDYSIIIEEKEFFFTELEFYYYSKEHPDPYVHKSKLQQEFGSFYVHHKDGNYGGIDLVFGNKNIYCGVLIRGIKDSKEQFISGPNIVKKEAFYKTLQVDKYNELQNIINEKVKLKKNSEKKDEKIYHSNRIGLKPIFEDYKNNGIYIYKLHRFIAYPINNHKYKEKTNVLNYNKE